MSISSRKLRCARTTFTSISNNGWCRY
jgi:hypothetical protein